MAEVKAVCSAATADETAVVLSCVPPLIAVTLTEKVHEPLAGKVAPFRLMRLELGIADIVPPPQLPDNPFGLETRSPDGNESLK